ncbi:MAG: glycosyltransferase family 1 protein [bacterium]
MKIGIDARDLEGGRTGVGRYLINLLQEWDGLDLPDNLEFILYFREELPRDLNLTKTNFKYKVLKYGHKSNALFMHILLPFRAYKDRLNILFCPAYISPILYFKKTALTLHDIIYEAHPELFSWKSIFDRILLRKFSKISAKRAKKIFVPSGYTKEEVNKYYKTKPNRVIVTYLGADKRMCPINDDEAVEQIKIKYGLGDKFIMFLGSIVNRRHLPEIIKAFEKLIERLPDYQFLLIGRNYTSPFIDIDNSIKRINDKYGKELILRQKYFPDEDLPLIYNATDLFIWLSDYEGFGLPVFEAMSCGVPTVTSPITSIPEIAKDAVLYVKNPTDVDIIFKTIYKGLTDNDLRFDLIKKGLERSKMFSWKKCAKETLRELIN